MWRQNTLRDFKTVVSSGTTGSVANQCLSGVGRLMVDLQTCTSTVRGRVFVTVTRY